MVYNKQKVKYLTLENSAFRIPHSAFRIPQATR